MTLYQIEVRATSDSYDGYARQLVQDILQLPIHSLPSLATIVDTPLFIRTAQLYHLSGSLSDTDLEQLKQQLLVDPVVQEARPVGYAADVHTVDVFYHPGVTDTLAESVIEGAKMLGIQGLEHVETGLRFLLDQRLSEEDVRFIAQSLLFNPVIQTYEIHCAGDRASGGNEGQPVVQPTTVAQADASERKVHVTTVFISGMNDNELIELSRSGLLALNLEEMRTIQAHYRELGREPTDVELETIAQTWSEHCSHKTFKATIEYREQDEQGQTQAQETIHGLLKSYIMRATKEVQHPYLVSAFSDNAGIIRFTGSHDLAFKVETHNHPSAIEPFGGANTGVGGVIRDVLGVSAQPIACTDILCFGPPDTPVEELPQGVLSPRRIASGVVNGVRDYGNKMGIPTVNGAILYHKGYIYNPLVFCGCLGVLPHGSHPNAPQPGDLIVVLGGRTGRDGIHGATFSSGEMSHELNTQAGSAVQIGAPMTEKKVTEAVIQARDRRLYNAITDCGAGGFSSAVGEMAAKTGARVELAHAPLKYQGLAPWEIWLSEAQERMVLAVPPAKLQALLDICEIEEVEVSVIGEFTRDKRLTVTYQGQVVADISMEFLHDGCPLRTLEATWTRKRPDTASTTSVASANALGSSYGPALLALLRHPSIASKEDVVRRYDHEVQGATIRKPLVGRAGNGPGDAAVLQPLQPVLGEETRAGVVLSNGVNPLHGTVDPYHMAVNAVDEALRNITAVGGDITRTAILDNFCWGNPTDPEQLGTLVRAVKGCYDAAVGFKVPFISGKDSLNNEYRADGKRLPVIPTLVISAVSVIEDAAKTVDMALKTPGNLLYLVGRTRNELAGSHLSEVVDPGSLHNVLPQTEVPQVEIPTAFVAMKALGEAIRRGLVRACHDLSEGGLAVAAAEMSLASMLGVRLDVAQVGMLNVRAKDEERLEPTLREVTPAALDLVRLFSESQTRFLVEVTPEQVGAFELQMRGAANLTYLGRVTQDDRFVIVNGEKELINLSVEELQEAWKGGQA
ncbi:phosphoribosylformylglycinamidine synthase subunit II [Thermosporothrix hazakensis]|uniref:Phosphoribosylformylglycinamidine synthase subunit PurL n=2 Tax=Thermosporothrix TaxID=768650 RepID=A0A326U1C9_THEHA|nr:phosphoribosylformylglycinamidine synthase subunit PurL [Thermosporothrix hazakensis]PZW23435.1 phosphoribosylformylglycinamidine synthase subunit II [Thermosporothrix hazakensis]BBH89781.1 phosphoribosylformylglycinamidine synthase subunit PurL [Thermosporothrix sp. COM3]GCE47970.1 phosphoribosylformylglycinamidine synthase subunit PurL [Thermosporothrix hazakensis]